MFRKSFKKAAALFGAAILAVSSLPAAALADSYVESVSGLVAEASANAAASWDMSIAQLKNVKEGMGGEYTLTLDDGGRSLISMFGLDLSWFNSLKMTLAEKFDETRMFEVMNLLLNDTSIASLNYLLDTTTGDILMKVPELSDYAMKVNLVEALQASSEMAGASVDMDPGMFMFLMQVMLKILNNPEAYLISGSEFQAIVNRYGNIILSHLTSTASVADSIRIGAIASDYTLMEAQLPASELIAVAKDILAAAQTDPELQSAFGKLAAFLPGITFDQIAQLIGELNTSLDNVNMGEVTPDDKIIFRLWKDAEGNVEAHQFVVNAADEGEVARVTILAPNTAEGNGLYVDITAEGQNILQISGTGTNVNGVQNGSYTVSFSGMKVIGIQVTDAYADNVNGNSSAIVSIYPMQDVLALLDESTAGLVSGLALTFSCKVSNFSSTNVGMNISMNGTSLGTITFAAYPVAVPAIPDAASFGQALNATSNEDVETFMNSMNIGNVLESLYNAGAGDFINSLMGVSDEVAANEAA